MPESAGREIQIGGPEVLTHLELVNEMASALGRRPPRRIRMSGRDRAPRDGRRGRRARSPPATRRRRRDQPRADDADRGHRPERRASCSRPARTASTRCSPRPSTRADGGALMAAASASRSSSPPTRSGSGTRSWTRRCSSAGSPTHDSYEGVGAGPLDEGDEFTPEAAARREVVQGPVARRRGRSAAARALGGRGPGGSTANVVYRLAAEDGGTRFDYENEFALPGGALGKAAGGLLAAAPGSREARQARSSALRTLLEGSPEGDLGARCRVVALGAPVADEREQRVDEHREHPRADQRDRDLGPHRVRVEADLRDRDEQRQRRGREQRQRQPLAERDVALR